jgi:hypothetical protein
MHVEIYQQNLPLKDYCPNTYSSTVWQLIVFVSMETPCTVFFLMYINQLYRGHDESISAVFCS